MKTTKFIYISATVLIVCLSACNKQLNIKPVESVDQTLAIKTAKDVQGVLAGTYNRLGQVDLYGGRIFMEPDLLASQNEINWTGSYIDLTK